MIQKAGDPGGSLGIENLYDWLKGGRQRRNLCQNDYHAHMN